VAGPARPVQPRPAQADEHRAFGRRRDREVEPSENEAEITLVRHVLDGEEFDTHSLRKAIVLSEILAQPLAIRRGTTGPWDRPE